MCMVITREERRREHSEDEMTRMTRMNSSRSVELTMAHIDWQARKIGRLGT